MNDEQIARLYEVDDGSFKNWKKISGITETPTVGEKVSEEISNIIEPLSLVNLEDGSSPIDTFEQFDFGAVHGKASAAANHPINLSKNDRETPASDDDRPNASPEQ
ncbi:hypothetical protein niasHS_009485 [Heterodera schachtii]|uniref:Uncharacterized protein n=1 Tax=Heterodera schachtii TaxID=97005 RepID=A0ABD2J090_HETSC